MSEPLKPAMDLVREWRESATSMNCQLHSGVGYTAHFETKCPMCVTLIHAKQLEAWVRPWDDWMAEHGRESQRLNTFRARILGVPPK